MNISIIYENHDLLVIDKPAGVVVNRCENAEGQTIQDWAEEKLEIKSLYLGYKDRQKLKVEEEDFHKRAGIVHRLDKDTSGLLLIAKNPKSFKDLQSQFFNRLVSKRYLTLVHGRVSPERGEIRVPVGRLPWARRKFGVLQSGREALTSYFVIAYYDNSSSNTVSERKIKKSTIINSQLCSNNIFTLLEVVPQTGRTHQIRIHLKYLGFSVVSDKLYAGNKVYKNDLKLCPRLFLHAGYLRFMHPKTGEWIELKSELPKDLLEVLNKLSIINI